MTDIDEEIRKALSEQEQDLARQFEELGLIGQFKSVFKGKTGWVSFASLIAGTLIQILFFYCAWKFFVTTGTNDKILWGGAAWFCAMMVAFMKVWFWMRMETNRVLRELKRLELQIAHLRT